MNKPPTLGDQELSLLRYVTDHAPITVREVAEQFGETHGLARTTILTMMERLRKKNFLTRRKDGGAFRTHRKTKGEIFDVASAEDPTAGSEQGGADLEFGIGSRPAHARPERW